MKEENSLFKIFPPIHQGHTIFKINHITKEVLVADVVVDGTKRKIIPEDGCEYVAALNMKNAIKHYNKGK